MPVCPHRPSGLTPDPLDYAFPWHLLSVLGAVGALPPAVVELPQGGSLGHNGMRPPAVLLLCTIGSHPVPCTRALSSFDVPPKAALPSLVCPAAAAARMSFIAQLEAVGGLAHWAVYAALHIPDAAERARASRG